MNHSILKRSVSLLLAVLCVLAIPASALDEISQLEALQAEAAAETDGGDPYGVTEDEAVESDGEVTAAETVFSGTKEVALPDTFVDENGDYLPPERLYVYIMRRMQEDTLSDPKSAEEKYTGVVVFYDYALSDGKARLERPYVFYYEKGVLQEDVPAYYTAKGYLDLTEAPVRESSINTAVQTGEDRPVYVAEEFYVEPDDDAHPAYLYAFTDKGGENGLFTGVYEGERYENGLTVPAEPAEAPVETPAADEAPAGPRKTAKAPVKAPGEETVKTVPTVNTELNEKGVQINWTADSEAKGYRVLRREGEGDWQTLGNLNSGKSSSYLDRSVKSGVTYTYTVAAYYGDLADIAASDTADAEVWSDVEETAPLCYLTAPKSGASGSDDAITVTWSAVAGAESYSVFRSEEGGDWVRITTVQSPTLSYTDKNVQSGVHYYYTVRANTTTANSFSLYTDTRTDVTKSVSLHATPVVQVSPKTDGAKLSWGQDADATGYRILRRAAGGSWEVLANITSGKTDNYLDQSVEYGKNYLYAVRAYYGDSANMESVALSSKELWSDQRNTDWFYYLEAPSSNAAGSESTITVKWNAVELAQSYSVFRSEEGGNWTRIATVKSPALTYTDSDVQKGVYYHYTVRANYDARNAYSAYYDYRTASDRRVMLHDIPVVTLKSKPEHVMVMWTEDSDAVGYRLFRKENSGSWVTMANVTADDTLRYLDDTAVYGTTYQYAVRAFYGDVNDIETASVSKAEQWSDMKGVPLTYLEAPEITQVSAGNGYMDIQWKPVTAAEGYIVYRRTSLTEAWEKVGTAMGATSFKDKTAEDGVSYYYGVKAFKPEGNNIFSYSDQNVYTDAYTYYAPISAEMRITASGNRINWTLDERATGYRIYRKVGNGPAEVLKNYPAAVYQAGTTTASYTDPVAGLTEGETYQYAVRAYYGSDNVSEASTAGGVNWGGCAYYKVIYLATPKMNSVAETEATGIKVKWTPVTAANGYYIFRRIGEGSWSHVGTVSNGVTNAYVDTTASKLAAGTVCHYTVIAFVDRNLPNSSYDTVGSYSIYLPKPAEVKVTAPTASGITVMWSAVDGTTLYDVYRRSVESKNWTQVSSVSGTTFVDTAIKGTGGAYYYTIRPRTTVTVNDKSLTLRGAYDLTGYLSGLAWTGKERDQWVTKKGNTYYVDQYGTLLSGWQYVTRNGKRYKYYFDPDNGALVTNMYSYFGPEARDWKCRIEVYINSKKKSNPSCITIYAYDQNTGSYCIPTVSFRCIGNPTLTLTTTSAYLRKNSGIRWLDSIVNQEQYATCVKGTNSWFHSCLYRFDSPWALKYASYNSMVDNKNNSSACIRMQCIYAFLIQDIMKHGYGHSHRVPVSIYKNGSQPGPFGVPKVDKISARYTDPTDPAITGKFWYSTKIQGIKTKGGAKEWEYYV